MPAALGVGAHDCATRVTTDLSGINRALRKVAKKKVKFHGIFRDKFAEKSAVFAGIFGANFAEKQSVKKWRILWLFSGKFP